MIDISRTYGVTPMNNAPKYIKPWASVCKPVVTKWDELTTVEQKKADNRAFNAVFGKTRSK